MHGSHEFSRKMNSNFEKRITSEQKYQLLTLIDKPNAHNAIKKLSFLMEIELPPYETASISNVLETPVDLHC